MVTYFVHQKNSLDKNVNDPVWLCHLTGSVFLQKHLFVTDIFEVKPPEGPPVGESDNSSRFMTEVKTYFSIH